MKSDPLRQRWADDSAVDSNPELNKCSSDTEPGSCVWIQMERLSQKANLYANYRSV